MMTTTTKAPNTNLCLCGCGAQVTKTFAQGHDARLRGLAVRAAKGEALLADLSPEAHTWLEETHGHPCLCGCGRLVAGRFAQGHDAKLRAAVLRGVRGEAIMPMLTTAARAWLRTACWMTGEIDAALTA